MILPKCFTPEFLSEQGKLLQVGDLRNLEKCTLALELVSRLQREGLDFIFKGGTSLLLHCNPARRLSIDVDILSLEPVEKFQEVLQKITRDAPFVRWDHQDHRDREAPPTKHFKAFYTSALTGEEASVQLDVICAENPYARTIEATVNASFLEISDETRVRIPTASCLLADKIAAFAPTTIGYPYYPIVAATGLPTEPRPIKVIKHLYDIGVLAEIATDTGEVIATYRNIHAEQIKFRGTDHTLADALQDTQTAAYHVCRIGGQKQNAANQQVLEQREILTKGIAALGSHLFTEPFQRAESQIAAAKAALAARMILHYAEDFNISGFLSDSYNPLDLKTAELTGPWEHISQPLKKGNIDAFRIWHRAQEITPQ
jgi:hypothetical protein